MLYNRALLLLRKETTVRTDKIGTDGGYVNIDTPGAPNLLYSFLVEDPVFGPDINQLQRQNVRESLSQDPIVTGRKIASLTFRHEVRGAGVAPVVGTIPRIGEILECCAMARTWRDSAITVTAPLGAIVDVLPGGSDCATLGVPNFVLTGSQVYAGTKPRRAYMEFTTGGVSAVVKTGWLLEGEITDADENTGQSFTDTDTIEFGTSGGDGVLFTADVSSGDDDAAIGDRFEIDVLPAAHEYAEVSDESAQEACSIYLYYDGICHKMKGCRGTWALESSGMEYSRFSFTFTGDYMDPEDITAIPTPNYENVQPQPLELAQLALQREFVGSAIGLCAQQFTMDLANNVVIRECINQTEAYAGAVIVGRNPVGSFNPEAVPEATFPFWATLKNGTVMGFRAIVGSNTGNVVSFRAPSAQIGNIGYGNRTELRTYETELQFAGVNGDDEIVVAFS